MTVEKARYKAYPCHVYVNDSDKQLELKKWLFNKGYYVFGIIYGLHSSYPYICVNGSGDATAKSQVDFLHGECCGDDVELFKSICEIRL